jgi:hypothetical protein
VGNQPLAMVDAQLRAYNALHPDAPISWDQGSAAVSTALNNQSNYYSSMATTDIAAYKDAAKKLGLSQPGAQTKPSPATATGFQTSAPNSGQMMTSPSGRQVMVPGNKVGVAKANGYK